MPAKIFSFTSCFQQNEYYCLLNFKSPDFFKKISDFWSDCRWLVLCIYKWSESTSGPTLVSSVFWLLNSCKSWGSGVRWSVIAYTRCSFLKFSTNKGDLLLELGEHFVRKCKKSWKIKCKKSWKINNDDNYLLFVLLFILCGPYRAPDHGMVLKHDKQKKIAVCKISN